MFLIQVGALSVEDESCHDDDQSGDVKRGDGGVLRHKRQSEGQVSKGDHHRHCQPQDVCRSIFQDEDDQNVVKYIEQHVCFDVVCLLFCV
jgi:hypothetical protein